MLIKCQVIIMNRLAPGHDTRQCHGTLILGKKKNKKKNEEEVFFTLHTTKNKSGIKYMILKNVLKIHNRFVDSGKCTLSMIEPPHDLAIAKADAATLKKFLHVIRLVLKGETESIATDLSDFNGLKNTSFEKPKTRMFISSRKDYPLKSSFPVTLEQLNIHSCTLKVFDKRILKLIHLKILDLSGNNLNALCESLDNLGNLRCLNLSHNSFKTFPFCILKGKTASRLTTLDLSHNNLCYVPAELSSLKNLAVLKLYSNKIQALPSSIGCLRSSLQRFECSDNLLKYMPWSFSNLQLDFVDISKNFFCEMGPGVLEKNKEMIEHHFRIPSLFEFTARFVVKTSVKKNWAEHLLPRHISRMFENITYCPCGDPCLTHGLPFVEKFDLSKVSSTVSYSESGHNEAFVNIATRLCSRTCYQNYLHNPKGFIKMKKK